MLFFSILTGMLFRNQPFVQPAGSRNNLSYQEKRWIENALKDNNVKADVNDPKVIVVKQESNDKEKDDSADDHKSENNQYNNPYVYAYPPEYYYDEDDYEDYYEDDYEE